MDSLRFQIIIPAHNEADVIAKTLDSLTTQTLQAQSIIVVNDNSSDDTYQVVSSFTERFPFITQIVHQSSHKHQPGSKVVNAFYKGYESITQDYDIICKFDADLIFPQNYLETLNTMFVENQKIGIASGILHIEKDETWAYEPIADKSHVRGPIKAYRKHCFEDIGGLKPSIGWDTVDVLLAIYHNWSVKTNEQLIVKHLKPTGENYSEKGFQKQGEAFFKLRYGIIISVIGASKIAWTKGRFKVFIDYLKGYFDAKSSKLPYLVSEKEGQFIRNYRWKGIFNKLTGN